ncbi:hypothetical protein LINPERHAP1_LOCUS15610, partial [Linum perenne]
RRPPRRRPPPDLQPAGSKQRQIPHNRRAELAPRQNWIIISPIHGREAGVVGRKAEFGLRRDHGVLGLDIRGEGYGGGV